MKFYIISTFIFVGMLISVIPIYGFSNQADVKITVIDETGKAISDAIVKLGFSKEGVDSHGRNKSKTVSGTTDKSGAFSANSNTIGSIGYIVTKEGYYDTRGRINFPHEKDKSGEWIEWKRDMKLLLRRIENPVPMYAKNVIVVYKGIDKSVGFDCEKADLVAPYGEGIVSDFVIYFTGVFQKQNIHSEKISITFPKSGDGIREISLDPENTSKFKLPRHAFEDGYVNHFEATKSFTGKAVEKINYREDQSFIFRVRSVLDKNGKVMKANYGKIKGPIEFGMRDAETSVLGFEIYFNPDLTRNLEFDPKQNLIKGLWGRYRVLDP